MNGRELLAKIYEANGHNETDSGAYAEEKLSEFIDAAQFLLQEHKSNGEKYTDAGHSNCISKLGALVKEIEDDAGPEEVLAEEPSEDAPGNSEV